MEKKDRLKAAFEYLKSVGLAHTQKDVATRMNATPQNVSAALKGNQSCLTESFLRRFNNSYNDVFNLDWLLHGDGEMLGDGIAQDSEGDVLWLPVINLDTRGGLTSNTEVDTMQYDTTQMPFSRNVARAGDFVMPVVGDSMTPKYPNGTYVLVRPLPTWKEYLELGATYVLELLDGRRILKDVRAGHDLDHFTLYSVNPSFDPTEIAKDFINHIFAVIISVRRELNW